MGKVTVSETVSRSVTVDNNVANNIQSATTRCFQFLEEGRFEEAHVIIEQILNIEPNNTDAHVANFLCHFRLTCMNKVVCKPKNIDDYINSVFYNRIANGSQTNLSLQLNSLLNMAKSQQVKTKLESSKFRYVSLMFLCGGVPMCLLLHIFQDPYSVPRGVFGVIIISLCFFVMALKGYITTNQKIKLDRCRPTKSPTKIPIKLRR